MKTFGAFSRKHFQWSPFLVKLDKTVEKPKADVGNNTRSIYKR